MSHNLIDHPPADGFGTMPASNPNGNPFDDLETPFGPYAESHNLSAASLGATPGASDRYDYFDGTGIGAPASYDVESLHGPGVRRDPAYAGASRRSGVFTDLYSNVKSRLGMSQPDYTEMGLPLTELSAHNPGASLDPVPPAPNLGLDSANVRPKPVDDTPKRDFDVTRLYRRLLGRREVDPASLGPRHIVVCPQEPSTAVFKDNHISTTKYNVATFVPKFLFEQFSKYANLFFLCTSAIQQVPNVSPTNRYTTIGTLAVVLLVSAVKELIEDVKRNNADKELNNSQVQVLGPSGEFELRRWIKVKVGDVVRVTSEQPFPADLVLLASSEPEGLCYIETANLDGETNLKIKQALAETAELVSPRALSRIRADIMSEQPNSSLYTFDATLQLDSGPKVPLTPDQLLLRGATLRNTPWIHGIVVFTGHETKLMRNASAAPIKRTAVEHMLNLQILFLFAILIVLALVSALGNVIKIKTAGSELAYLYLDGTSLVGLFFSDLLTYWVLFSNLVPISLFVTVEIVKFYQAMLISSDLDMYYKETDTPAVCRTSSLVEELGQIEYIFSDKTGTLTRNIMEFKSCSIAGKCYASEIPEDRRADTMVDDVDAIGYYDFDTLARDMDNGTTGQVIQEFFTLLASCHTVIPEIKDDGAIKYQAASPDEGALVAGAADQGFRFVIRRPKSITIDIRGQEYQYELLNICEFNSTRKRMSAVFRCPDGKIRLYCKGADTVILERLAPADNPFVDTTMAHLEDFAGEGLRTLCLAMRVIPEDEYREWSTVYDEAVTSLDNRAGKLDAAAEQVEHDLFLLGATAIEDKLQDGVPETIHTLQDAGIKIWVLTGDRQETAINIGMSCKLLSEDMNLLIVNEHTFEAVRADVEGKLRAVQSGTAGNMAEADTFALIIDGKSLEFALDPTLERAFLDLAVRCKAVVCCRVSPLQKALVVRLVKRHLKSLLLAIGDGANDVSMIQAAHVGVGISGLEGMQAARSADVSIGQFRFLRKLLLVHGAWSYNRLSKAILYSFYKNIALYMTQFWFVFFNGFSGQSIYESWSITFYNVFFTVMPPFILGIFDQYISGRLLDRYPQLYRLGQRGAFFNVRAFWEWILNGFYHSIILYVGGYLCYRDGNVLADGLVANHWTWGAALYTACIATTLGKAALVTTMWNKFTLVAIPGSMAIWLAFLPPYSTVAPLVHVSTELRGVLAHLYPTLVFWAMAVVLPCMCLVRDLAWKYYKRMYRAESYHHVQEIQKYNIADYRPRMEQFQKAIRKVRQVQRMRKQRGFAFSQADEGQARVVRAYDTTQARGEFGEMRAA